jgi:hypothetical protein
MLSIILFIIVLFIICINNYLLMKIIHKIKLEISNIKKEHMNMFLNNDSTIKKIDGLEKLLIKDIADIKTDISYISNSMEKENNIKFDEFESL